MQCLWHFLQKCIKCTNYFVPEVVWEHPDVYLHPEEESFGTRFELQHINSPGRALIHPFELAVVGKDDQVLNEGEEHLLKQKTTQMG